MPDHSFSSSHPSIRTSSTQLLVSVQNATEAALACQLGVPWIDLKNPAAGALGSPTATAARSCLAAIASVAHAAQHPLPQTSVALGELRNLDLSLAGELLQLFPIAKFGLADSGTSPSSDRTLSQQLQALQQASSQSGQLVPAIYADHQRAAAWPPEAVIDLAGQLSARYVLIDTYVKDGRGLFDWFSLPKLAELQSQVDRIGAELVVAGSLQAAHWPQLRELNAAIVGVRGSVCDTSTDRTSGINAERIKQWLAWTREPASRRALGPYSSGPSTSAVEGSVL